MEVCGSLELQARLRRLQDGVVEAYSKSTGGLVA